MHRHHRARILAATVLLLSASAIACDDDDPARPDDDPAGTYVATMLIADPDGANVDMLALGTSLTITLHENGTTTGTFFVPEGADDGSDLEADLAGTWLLDSGEIEFDHPTDTFIRDVLWEYEGNRLELDIADLWVILTRQ